MSVRRYVLTGAPGAGKTTLLEELRRRAATGEVIFFDRSPLCTPALARHLDRPVPAVLRDAVEERAGTYERQVFLAALTALTALPPVGGIDQFIDSTDVAARPEMTRTITDAAYLEPDRTRP